MIRGSLIKMYLALEAGRMWNVSWAVQVEKYVLWPTVCVFFSRILAAIFHIQQ